MNIRASAKEAGTIAVGMPLTFVLGAVAAGGFALLWIGAKSIELFAAPAVDGDVPDPRDVREQARSHGKVAARIAAAAAGRRGDASSSCDVGARRPRRPRPTTTRWSSAAPSTRGKHQREIVDWATAHHAALNALPSAFFTVCLTAAEDTPESRAATTTYLDDFLQATGWTPATTATFAGALQYREYDFMTRLLMRLLMRKGGRPTDASRDYDYTDWGAVEQFGRACAALAAEPAGRPGR